MPNGDDFDDPRPIPGPILPTIPRGGRRPPTLPDLDDPERGGLPLPAPPVFPLPVPPRQPAQIIRFPVERTRPPARPELTVSRIGQLLRIGNVAVGVAVIADALIRKAQDITIEREQFEREAVFELETRRRALAREPVEIVITDPRVDPGPDPFEFPAPEIRPLPAEPEIQTEPLEIPGVQPPGQPVITPGEIEIPGPSAPTLPAPATVPAPVPATVPTPRPAAVPGIGSVPGVFTLPAPGPLPGIFPVPLPIGRPSTLRVGDPLTAIETAVPRLEPTPTGFADVLDFPQPVPQQQPARRCEPCPEERPPEPRTECFKGLYREGPTTDDIDFTEWVEIDCFTGQEI